MLWLSVEGRPHEGRHHRAVPEVCMKTWDLHGLSGEGRIQSIPALTVREQAVMLSIKHCMCRIGQYEVMFMSAMCMLLCTSYSLVACSMVRYAVIPSVFTLGINSSAPVQSKCHPHYSNQITTYIMHSDSNASHHLPLYIPYLVFSIE